MPINEEIHSLIMKNPGQRFTRETIADELRTKGLDASIETVDASLSYLCAIEREIEPDPRFKGIAKVFIRGGEFYEALSDNPDILRDYDYRATNEGGRDFCPKNMAYYIWTWISMAEEKFENEGIKNNKVILITHDCRFYPKEIIDAALHAAGLRGCKVIFAYAFGSSPSCVSSYSFAVRLAQPGLAVFITASHVSRPKENTIVGAKVSILSKAGRLESISTHDIKVVTPRILSGLKSRNDLCILMKSPQPAVTIEVGEAHTKMIALGALAGCGLISGKTLFEIGEELRNSSDIQKTIDSYLDPFHAVFPPVLSGLGIVIEGAYTSSGALAEKAFSLLGAKTYLLHGDVREVTGEHKADPSITDNLKDLYAAMTEQKAHMGIAFDLDGDRGAIVLKEENGNFQALPPDKIGQVLMPFLMKEGGYGKAGKPLYVRDCLSTDAIVDQARLSGITVETTDAGYVYLKKCERERLEQGYTAIGMGEASGHAWLHFTGAFENPIAVAVFFAVMSLKLIKEQMSDWKEIPFYAIPQVLEKIVIPYRKSPRFQPLFSPGLIAQAAALKENDTGWRSGSKEPMPQKIINLCRDKSIRMLKDYFTQGRSFKTKIGTLKVQKFETQFDEADNIHRFAKIYFSLNDIPAGSFVTRASSNDPTAVQVWEVREFGTEKYEGKRLSDDEISLRFDLIGGLVLDACEKLDILKLVDEKPAKNMKEVLVSVERLRRDGLVMG